MSHPGYAFTRLSYHTLTQLRCPRRAYLDQYLGLRLRPTSAGRDGPLGIGIVFHSLMEWHYTAPRARTRPMQGTEGAPVCATVAEVLAHYEGCDYSHHALDVAEQLYNRYCWAYPPEKDGFSGQVLGVEQELQTDDLAEPYKPLLKGRVPYAARYDLIVKVPGSRQVAAVEHKTIRSLSAAALAGYADSGQVVGQCALWNSRSDLVAQYGRMDTIWLNLVLKAGEPNRPVHRACLFIPPQRQAAYVWAVAARERELRQRQKAYTAARGFGPRGVAEAWPELGLVNGDCVTLARTCPFLSICHDCGIAHNAYEITDEGAERVEKDGLVRLEGVGRYVP